MFYTYAKRCSFRVNLLAILWLKSRETGGENIKKELIKLLHLIISTPLP